MKFTARGARCSRCGLPATHPLARLSPEGECALCRRQPLEETRRLERQAVRGRMIDLFDRVRGQRGVHVVVAASGGKDSSWTLSLLRRCYGLRVKAVAVDNGFMSPMALENLRVVSERLGVSLEVVRPPRDVMCRLFARAAREEPFSPSALQRASGICNACIGLVKSVCLRRALEEGAPLLGWGWSPGQASLASAVFRPSGALARQMQATLQRPLISILGDDILDFLPTPAQLANEEDIPTFIAPLAVHDYDETQMRAELNSLGWRAPEDTDANSTNCLLNGLANHLHRRRHGVHPYALELAGLVRAGCLSPDAAAERLASVEDADLVAEAARSLGLDEDEPPLCPGPGGLGKVGA